MGRAKEIILKVIPAKIANEFVKKYHYSGKVVNNSTLHFGAFLDNRLHGVMSFGHCMNKKGTIDLVEGTGWNGFLELNRMAFDQFLPRNSESRALSIAFNLIKKNSPHIKWVISFADATSCGDGAIYRASGFLLVGIAVNTSIRQNRATGEVMHIIQAHHKKIVKDFKTWTPLNGYMVKYIKLLHPNLKITVPIIPFSKIKEMGASMYKGKRIAGETIDTVNFPVSRGGETPTAMLQTA